MTETAPLPDARQKLSRILGSAFAAATVAACFWLCARAAVQGAISTRLGSFLLPMTATALGVCVWHGARAAGMAAGNRPLWRRHGFWLGGLLACSNLPQLGGFTLIDPWETHYAEVAREMSARGDFISPWWAHEGWFMSKPVLALWLEALSMWALDVNVAADSVLLGSHGDVSHPEWAIRLPGALFMSAGCWLLCQGVAAWAGRTAGFFVAVVLATSTQWVLISRHAVTDAAFAGALAGAFGLALLACSMPENQSRTHSDRQRSTLLGTKLIAITGISAIVLPQLVLLVSQHADVLWEGSPGNCGLPGQRACGAVPLTHAGLSLGLQACLWFACGAVLITSILRARQMRSLVWLGAWYFAGLACMSKGIGGLALPLGVGALFYLSRGRLRPLPRFELWRGGLLVVTMVAPWYVAMYGRHGRVFIDELVLRHMLGRALDHLHDTNAGVDVSFRYYAWQLGYALFPWIGLVPAAVLVACKRRLGRPERLQHLLDAALLALLLTFALFAAMGTKFHHYILPALPAASVLIGCYLSERWHACLPTDARNAHRDATVHVLSWGGALLITAVGVDLVTAPPGGIHGSARLFHLISYQYDRAWPERLNFAWPLGLFAGVCAILSAGLGWQRIGRIAVALHLLVAAGFAAWTGQHYLPALAPAFGQREVIERFYRERAPGTEPLIAYQLNWKGENFYTGNHLAIFVRSGDALKKYLAAQRALGRSIFDFVLEPSRLPALRRELGDLERLSVISDQRPGDKFCLARAELP